MHSNWYIALGLPINPPTEDEDFINNRIDILRNHCAEDNESEFTKDFWKSLPKIKKDMIGVRNRRKILIKELNSKIIPDIKNSISEAMADENFSDTELNRISKEKDIPIRYIKDFYEQLNNNSSSVSASSDMYNRCSTAVRKKIKADVKEEIIAETEMIEKVDKKDISIVSVNVRAIPEEHKNIVSFCINDENLNSEYTYSIIRSENGIPSSSKDGICIISEFKELIYEDFDIEPAVYYGYAVYPCNDNGTVCDDRGMSFNHKICNLFDIKSIKCESRKSEILISWTGIPDNAELVIYRSCCGKTETQLQITKDNMKNGYFNDKNLNNGIEYHYRAFLMYNVEGIIKTSEETELVSTPFMEIHSAECFVYKSDNEYFLCWNCENEKTDNSYIKIYSSDDENNFYINKVMNENNIPENISVELCMEYTKKGSVKLRKDSKFISVAILIENCIIFSKPFNIENASEEAEYKISTADFKKDANNYLDIKLMMSNNGSTEHLKKIMLVYGNKDFVSYENADDKNSIVIQPDNLSASLMNIQEKSYYFKIICVYEFLGNIWHKETDMKVLSNVKKEKIFYEFKVKGFINKKLEVSFWSESKNEFTLNNLSLYISKGAIPMILNIKNFYMDLPLVKSSGGRALLEIDVPRQKDMHGVIAFKDINSGMPNFELKTNTNKTKIS